MAFIVEDGTGLTNSNSYVSVTEADDYFADRGNADWAALSNDEKQQFLIQSAQYMDGEYYSRYIGYQKSESQSMAWPRECARNSVNPNIVYSSASIPESLKQAQLEGAEVARGGSSFYSATEKGLKKIDQSVDVIKDIKEYAYPTSGGNTISYTSIETNLRGLIRGTGKVKVIRA